jgi:hypothetical protein
MGGGDPCSGGSGWLATSVLSAPCVKDPESRSSCTSQGYIPKALRFASEHGHMGVLQMLLEEADQNTDVGFPLLSASEKGHAEVVQLLMNHEARREINREQSTEEIHATGSLQRSPVCVVRQDGKSQRQGNDENKPTDEPGITL